MLDRGQEKTEGHEFGLNPTIGTRAVTPATLRDRLLSASELTQCDLDELAKALRALGKELNPGDALPVTINGVTGGALDLRGYRGHVRLKFVGCTFERLTLSDAQLLSAELVNCTVDELCALRLQCAGSLEVRGGGYGRIELHGASAGGNWYIGFADPVTGCLRARSIEADGARVTGHAEFCGTRCQHLTLNGASIGRDLDLRAAVVHSPHKAPGLSLYGARVGGRLRFGGDCASDVRPIDARVDMHNMRVEGDVDAKHAKFNRSVNMEGMKVGGTAWFNRARFIGKVTAMNIRIDGDLICDGAEFNFIYGGATSDVHKAAGLDLSGGRIAGCGFFGADAEEVAPGGDESAVLRARARSPAVRARSPLRMRATEFGERLIFSRITMTNARSVHALNLVNSKIGTELVLDCANHRDVSYDLRDVSCRLLRFDNFPSASRLTGLRYSMMEIRDTDSTSADDVLLKDSDAAEAMLKFVDRNHGALEKFSPGPYKALEAYLHGIGSDGLSSDVAQRRRKRELAADRARAKTRYRRMRAYASSAVFWLAGYGYSATPAFLISTAIIIGFPALWTILPSDVGRFCAAKDVCCCPSFGSLLAVSLDNFVPFAKLGLSEGIVAVDKVGVCMLAVVRVLGFLLTTLMVGAWSGLMRKS